MNILFYTAIILLTFCIMEMFTWWLHKYVMHGFLWTLHEDHHDSQHKKTFERNDYFFIIFGTLSMTVFLLGTLFPALRILLFIACGITLYGAAYFFVHDVFIHQRIKMFRNTNNFYFRALRKAHKVHHKHLGKEEGECFGMLWVPIKYFKEALKSRQ
ncbi:MAG: sterol desaturase family protein [Bacteroidetes bacterium]|nr:sterol desaturase family protein [Bacteroidota bacterium]